MNSDCPALHQIKFTMQIFPQISATICKSVQSREAGDQMGDWYGKTTAVSKLFYKYHIKCTVHTVYTYFIIVVFQSEVCGIVIKNRKQTTIYNIFKKERLSENSLKVQFQPWLITLWAKLLASTNCNFSCNAIFT